MRLSRSLSISPIFLLITTLLSPSPSLAHCPTNPRSPLNFGSCSDPGILYGFNINNSHRYGYLPSNTTFFPHGWSPDIATIESFICNRLVSPCNAPPDTVSTCRTAFNLYSGLSGEDAVNAWNVALGLTPSDSDSDFDDNDYENDDCYNSHDSYLTTTTTTLFIAATLHPSADVTLTTTTQTLTTRLTSVHSETYTTRTHTVLRDPTLTLTITLPTTTTTDRGAVSMTSTLTATETTLATETNDATTSVVAETTTEAGSQQGGENDDDGGPGGGSPFDSESSTLRVPFARGDVGVNLLLLLGGVMLLAVLGL